MNKMDRRAQGGSVGRVLLLGASLIWLLVAGAATLPRTTQGGPGAPARHSGATVSPTATRTPTPTATPTPAPFAFYLPLAARAPVVVNGYFDYGTLLGWRVESTGAEWGAQVESVEGNLMARLGNPGGALQRGGAP